MFLPFLIIGADDVLASVVIAAMVSAVVGAISTGVTNSQNKEINQRNLDFQASQTQHAWERDDKYYQRSVADAQAAGLSPLAINGAMPNTAPLSAPNPIGMQSPLDASSMINAVMGSGQLAETQRHNTEEERLRGDEIANTAKEIQLKSRQIDIENKDVESEIKYRSNLITLESMRIAETERSNKANESLKEKQYNLEKLSFESKRYFEEIKHQAGGEDVPYKVYSNYNDYLTAREIYLEAYNNFLSEVTQTSTAHMKSQNGSGGINAMGTGMNIGAGATEYKSENWSEKQKMMWDKFQKKYPVPVYYYSE